MGLTIHYDLHYRGTSEKRAKALVEKIRQRAMDLAFDEVDEVLELEGDACSYDRADKNDPHLWLKIQARGSRMVKEFSTRQYWIDFSPEKMIVLPLWPGEGCEQMNVGLCRYPKTFEFRGKTCPTRMSSGWQWHSFCKTQYASNFGTEHFLRCHLSVVRILDYCKELNILKSVNDEGEYWDKRDIKQLGVEIGDWNSFVASCVASLPQAADGAAVAPITEHPDFEQMSEDQKISEASKIKLNKLLTQEDRFHLN